MECTNTWNALIHVMRYVMRYVMHYVMQYGLEGLRLRVLEAEVLRQQQVVEAGVRRGQAVLAGRAGRR